MPIAREGWRELLLGTVVLAALAVVGALWFWPAVVPCVVVWLWLVSFFRDPRRLRTYAPGEFCSPADGTVTEVAELDHYDPLDGPAVRIGIFLSLFNVHINRSPCHGRVRSVEHRSGGFLDARHPDSSRLNESVTVVLDPADGLPGPVVVRQVAGLIARRIVCHGKVGDEWPIGHRFGMIKFGSRTELIIPRLPETEVRVSPGDRVRAGLSIIAAQPAGIPEGGVRPAEAVADGAGV
ncbi:MAG: phosphatidylserine decarboxylase [bacterium]|nr:phosphatidylserine decarboxylase [bacterium]